MSKRIVLFIVVFSFVSVLQGCDSYDQDFHPEIVVNGIDIKQAITKQHEASALLDNRFQIKDLLKERSAYYLKFTNNNSGVFFYAYTPIITVSSDSDICLNYEKTRLLYDRSSYPTVTINEEDKCLINGIDVNWTFDSEYLDSMGRYNDFIVAIAEIDGSIILYYYHGDVRVLPIEKDAFYHVPSYFQEQLVKKEVMAESMLTKGDNNSLGFVFFTDAHWGANQKHSPAIVKHILDYTSIPWAIFGGDVITTHCTTAEEGYKIGEDFRQAFSPLGSRLYSVYGNHDDNSDGQPNESGRHLSEEQVYAYLQSQMKDVEYWDYYNYYFDDSKTKTRYVCLDTGRFYLKEFRKSSVKTVQFLSETLSHTPPGWHVIIISHLWCGLTTKGGIREACIDPYMKPILKVLDDFNVHASGEYAYEDKTVKYDFSKCEGYIEYCIGGHTHCDAILYTNGGIPLVIITTDSQQTINGEIATKGTTEEQSITLVITDYTSESLSLFRIGRGSDQIIKLAHHS